MSFLFIGSTGDHAGHSLVSWAIARRLMENGLNVGFIKPFGTQPILIDGLWTDRDAYLFKEVLNIQEGLDQICPYLVPGEAWKQASQIEVEQRIKALTNDLSRGKDILLIMGSDHIFFEPMSRPVSDVSLITQLGADLVLVDRYRKLSRSIYSILSVSSLLENRVKGVILNRIPSGKLEEIRGQMITYLAQKGIALATAIPEDPLLSFCSLGEIKEILDGEFLAGEESELDKPVGGMTVGSSDLKGKLLLFKRVYNKVVLLGPSQNQGETQEPQDRRSIVGVLLTGGRDPAPQVLETARKAGIPLVLVRDDTFAALARLEQATPAVSPKDEAKVRHFTELMDRQGFLDRLIQSVLTRC